MEYFYPGPAQPPASPGAPAVAQQTDEERRLDAYDFALITSSYFLPVDPRMDSVHENHAAVVYMWTVELWKAVNRQLDGPGRGVCKSLEQLMPFVSERMFYLLQLGLRTQNKKALAMTLQLFVGWLRPWRYGRVSQQLEWPCNFKRDYTWFQEFVEDNIGTYSVLFQDFLQQLLDRYTPANFVQSPKEQKDLCKMIIKVFTVFTENPGLVEHMQKVEVWMHSLSQAILAGKDPRTGVILNKDDHQRALKIFSQCRARLHPAASYDTAVVHVAVLADGSSRTHRQMVELAELLYKAQEQCNQRRGGAPAAAPPAG